MEDIGQLFGTVLVQFVPGLGNEYQLAAGNTPGKSQGRFFVGAVVFSAEYQGGAGNTGKCGGKVYLAGGGA